MCTTSTNSSSSSSHRAAEQQQQQLSTALHQAEVLLAEVHAAAVQSLSSGCAASDRLLAKQLRLKRNQAFEQARALLLKGSHHQAIE